MITESKQQLPTLTELTTAQENLTTELVKHTRARTYLYGLLTGIEAPAIIDISPTKGTFSPERDSCIASVELAKLPQDVSETIIVALLEHEERLAYLAWEQLTKNADTALMVIDKLKKAREAENKKVEQEDTILSIPKRNTLNE